MHKKKSFVVVLQNSFSKIFWELLRKTLAMKFFYGKVAVKNALKYRYFSAFVILFLLHLFPNTSILTRFIWGNLLKKRPSKICERQPLNGPHHFNGPHQFIKGCLSQILFGPFLSTLSHLLLAETYNSLTRKSIIISKGVFMIFSKIYQ